MRNAFFERPFSSSIGSPRFLRAAMPAPAKAPRRDPYKKMSDKEVRLARLWYKEDGMDSVEIAELLRRNKSTVTRLPVVGKERKAQGRPAMWATRPLTSWSRCWITWGVQADANHEVTVDMLRHRTPRPQRVQLRTLGRDQAPHARD
jgi:hypothetical protein